MPALPPRSGAATPPPSGAARPPQPGPNRARYRRRRGGAALALVAIIALAIGAAHSRGGTGPHRVPRTPRPAAAAKQGRAGRPRTRRRTQRRAEEQAIDRVLAYTPAITEGGHTGHELALTFDDGPGPYTAQFVHVLDSLHVKATFFAIGEEERWFSAGTLAELRSGDVVGDHTETHPMMARLSAHAQHEDLFEQILRIQLLDGPTPQLFRPPYGSFDATTFRQLRALHLLMVLWSDDTSDYALPGVAAIVQRALAGAHPGAIVLMHDGGGNRSETLAALPAIVRGLRRKGLEPVTVPRLMLDDPPPRGLPIPTSLAGD
ncbi:MAG TPA: polysaccharide deacetylase family protein [Solirubrobacteraceae bacterium]|jgi:peptidoglycan/xylan/chitin deacetylase (PgdA/CDA1 family)|nr:polysaccharide deacetylase family protein [Solirubrobacteraceae bacterium]